MESGGEEKEKGKEGEEEETESFRLTSGSKIVYSGEEKFRWTVPRTREGGEANEVKERVIERRRMNGVERTIRVNLITAKRVKGWGGKNVRGREGRRDEAANGISRRERERGCGRKIISVVQMCPKGENRYFIDKQILVVYKPVFLLITGWCS